MNILSPDKNNLILKKYHYSNKLLIPLLMPTLFLNNENSCKKYFDLFNIFNYSFHSYVSISSVITDYHKKIPFANHNIFRISSLGIHGFAILYLSNELYNKYYRPEIYYYNQLKRFETLPQNYHH